MQIIGVQVNTVWEDRTATHTRVRRLLDNALIRPGALIVLPEMFATGFTMHVDRIADDDEATQSFMAESAVAYQAYVLGGVVTRDADGRGRNEAVVYDPQGREIARYCKRKPFTYGGEPKHYVAGTQAVTFDWQGVTVAPLICYELRFPELFRELTAPVARQRDPAAGVHLFAVIANWPRERTDHWSALLRARAIENQAYLIGVNRTGDDPKLSYIGHSVILDPRGKVLDELKDEEAILTAEINLAELIAYRREFPALLDG